jgi:adenine/guanine phosphoribosyltransferase-like PRPP-binding protein
MLPTESFNAMRTTWRIEDNLIQFPRLESCTYPISALGFRILDEDQEKWTRRFYNFKFGDVHAKELAIRGACAVLGIAASTIQVYGPVAMVSAIGSSDTVLNPSCGLARLGAAIAMRTGWNWMPYALRKQSHMPRHKMSVSAVERDAVIAGVYTSKVIKARTVIIIDDFATRGATIAEIGRAICESSGEAMIRGLVLGKNERKSFAGTGVSNAHISSKYDILWQRG